MIEKSELIGENAEIQYSKKIFKGKIIDETKNTLTLQTEKKPVKIIKKNATITIKGKKIAGKKIAKRPEDRVKMC